MLDVGRTPATGAESQPTSEIRHPTSLLFMPLLLSCQSLTASFGARPLFEDISLSISDGDRLGLIGPNGSGKSTLLRILAGSETPDAGSTAVRKMAKLGYVPQDVQFPAELSVLQIMQEAAPSEDG